MSKPRILAFAGSTRTGSYNKTLVKLAAEAARHAGAVVTLVNLRDLPLPLFDEDFETASGLPENARKLKSLFREHDGFLISSPEYNSSITGVLKNTIDWASRAETDGEPPLVCFRGKIAAVISASPGALGGLRGLVHLRAILGNIGVVVLPDTISIATAHEAFDESGCLKDERKAKQLANIVGGLVNFIAKQKS